MSDLSFAFFTWLGFLNCLQSKQFKVKAFSDIINCSNPLKIILVYAKKETPLTFDTLFDKIAIRLNPRDKIFNIFFIMELDHANNIP